MVLRLQAEVFLLVPIKMVVTVVLVYWLILMAILIIMPAAAVAEDTLDLLTAAMAD